MKKTKPIKIILPTEGEKAAMASKLRKAGILPVGDEKAAKGRNSLVKTQDPLDTPIPVPKWIMPNNKHAYAQMIIKVCQIDFDDIAAFAREYGIARQTIYNWLRHQDTKDLIDEVVKAVASTDKPKVYEMILSQVPVNAAYARLWAERYEDYQPKSPSTGNVTINFNFLDPPGPEKPAKQADYEEIEE